MRRLERDDDRPLVPEARSDAEAAAELRACAGTHFDPRVVDALLAVVEAADRGAPLGSAPMEGFDADRYLVDQLVRPIVNLYRVTPLAAGETPAGPPVAYVRQKKMAIKEDIRFYADEGETQEIFRIKARSIFDIGGARYDVFVGEEKIGVLEHQFRASLLRSTWIVRGADEPS